MRYTLYNQRRVFSLILFTLLSFMMSTSLVFGAPFQYSDKFESINSGYSVLTVDEGYVYAGTRFNNDSVNPSDIHVYKTDMNGNIIWSYTYDYQEKEERCLNINHAPDGYIITGYVNYGDLHHAYLLSISPDGAVYWDNVYKFNQVFSGYTVSRYSRGLHVISAENSKSGFVVTGFISEHYLDDDTAITDGKSILVFKTDDMGNLVWHRTFDTPGNGKEDYDMGEHVVEVPDRGYFVTGSMNAVKGDLQDQGALALMLDYNGDIVWQNSLSTTSYDKPGNRDVGSFALADSQSGNIWLLANSSEYKTFYLTEFDPASGTVLNELQYKPATGEYPSHTGYVLKESQDKEHFVVAGMIGKKDFEVCDQNFTDNIPPFLFQISKKNGEPEWGRYYLLPSRYYKDFGGFYKPYWDGHPLIYSPNMMEKAHEDGYALCAFRTYNPGEFDVEIITTDNYGESICENEQIEFIRAEFERFYFTDIKEVSTKCNIYKIKPVRARVKWEAEKCPCPQPCVDPPLGMRAWWPFDEVSGSTAAEIINGNNGTHIGSPVFTPGMVDGALSFNGSTDYVEAPDDPSLDVGTGDFSIDAWIKTSQTDGIAAIIDKREAVCSCDTGMCLGGTEIGYHFFLYYGHLSLQLAAGSGGLTNYISNTSVADGSWHLVAVTVDRDQTDGIKFFVDGIMVESFNPTAYSGMSLDNLSPLTIGSRSPFLCSGSWFNGLIDEVELFGTALDQSDIMSIYNAGSSGKCKDFPCREVAWYPFDEHVGPTASDVVGGNNGTHMNNPLPITGGMVDYALHFDGTNDYVAVPDDPALNFGTGDLSIIAYIRTESKNMESLVDKRDQNTGIGYTFILLNGQLLFQLYDASGWYNYYASSPDLADGEWHCVAVTVDRDDPNGGKLYADGQPVLDFNPTNRPGNITNTAELWIGKHHANPGSSSTKCFDGDMDELKLFKCALTEIEIQAICQESIIFN